MKNTPYSLALFAALAALAACGPAALDEATELATGEQNITCSGMGSGEALGRGQSITSCNGRMTLAHQTDGNIVVYDGAGASWSSGTCCRSDSNWLVMQTDGNLVLYNTAGAALWSSGTAGNPGARLAVADDCNLIIYNSSNRAIWSTNTACRVNLLDYMINKGGALHDPAHGDMQQTRWDSTGRKFWYQKNPYDSTRWERYGYNDSRIWLERDTTLPAGEGPGTAYDNTPFDSMFFPRIWSAVSWAPNRTSNFSTTHKYYDYKTACSYNGKTTAWKDGRHTFRYLGWVNMGGNLGSVDVAVIDRYHDLNVNPYNPKTAERFWFAKGRGWVRWEYWADRTVDGNWNTNNITSTSPSKRRTFNTDRTAIGFQDVCTGLSTP
jgi:hypothetical protein